MTNHSFILDLDSNVEVNTFNDFIVLFKDIYFKIKQYLTYSYGITDFSQNLWCENVKIIENSLFQTAVNLRNLSFDKEYLDFLKIKNIIEYILEDKKLFDIYSEFVSELLSSFLNLIQFKDKNGYDEYFKSFHSNLMEKLLFFAREVHSYDNIEEKQVNEFTRAIME